MDLAVFEYALVATVVLLISACIGSFVKMGSRTVSLLQHLTAGVVFAAVATELLPKILETHSRFPIVLGFSLGVAVMVLVKTLTNQIESVDQFSWGLLIGVGVDLFIDGLLIAIAFLSSQETGKLVTLALILEVAFLTLSLATNLSQMKISHSFKWIIFGIFGLVLPLGTITGLVMLQFLPPTFFTEALSFGAAALLYLVTEELLVEAHETEDTPVVTSAFFIGFLIILLFKT